MGAAAAAPGRSSPWPFPRADESASTWVSTRKRCSKKPGAKLRGRSARQPTSQAKKMHEASDKMGEKMHEAADKAAGQDLRTRPPTRSNKKKEEQAAHPRARQGFRPGGHHLHRVQVRAPNPISRAPRPASPAAKPYDRGLIIIRTCKRDYINPA